MSRFFYIGLLSVMSLVGFGAVQAAAAASPSAAGGQDGVNVGRSSRYMGEHWWDRQPDPRPRSPAVAGIRG